jgi:hypothetical protein
MRETHHSRIKWLGPVLVIGVAIWVVLIWLVTELI